MIVMRMYRRAYVCHCMCVIACVFIMLVCTHAQVSARVPAAVQGEQKLEQSNLVSDFTPEQQHLQVNIHLNKATL